MAALATADQVNIEELRLAAEKIQAEAKRRLSVNKIHTLFPDEGPLRRELYKKHVEFFAMGAVEAERMFMGANRIGKTIVGGYESVCHLTGDYPDWWDGYRFEGPTDGWAAGDTTETTRDVVQYELTGVAGEQDKSQLGTGLIPKELIIGDPTSRRGVPGAIDTMAIKHVSGGISRIGFKSYDQGRRKFQGTKKHFIWLDEEPPMDVYSECLVRTMTTNGLMICTMTPLLGLSDVAIKFLPDMAPEGAAYDPGTNIELLLAEGREPPTGLVDDLMEGNELEEGEDYGEEEDIRFGFG